MLFTAAAPITALQLRRANITDENYERITALSQAPAPATDRLEET